MSTTVRDVRVVMEADVAKYIADMKAAGRATDQTFRSGRIESDSMNRSLQTTDRQLSSTTTHLRRTDQASQAVARSMQRSRVEVDGLSTSLRRSSTDLNQFTGRTRALAEAIAILGPAAIPIASVAVPAVSGLAMGLTALVGAGASAALAFSGVGDSMKAFNDFQAEPTVENLEKMEEAFDKLGPAGEQFVRSIDQYEPALERLQRTAGAEMFPGLLEGLDEAVEQLPMLEQIVSRISASIGILGRDAGASLGDDDWQAFFDYLRTDAAPTLDAFARSTGNFVTGFANLMTAMAPLSRDFTQGLLDNSRAFREWTAGLNGSEGMQDFIDYIRDVGPEVGEFFSSVGELLVDLATAMAPWGSTVLPLLTAVADAFSAIAGSPIGPTLVSAAAGMLLVSRAMKGYNAVAGQVGTATQGIRSNVTALRGEVSTLASGYLTAGARTEAHSRRMATAWGNIRSSVGSAVKTAGPGMAAFAALSSGAAEKAGLVNTATLTMAGSIAGPWGAAVGGGVGLLMDMKSRLDENAAAAEALDQALGGVTSLTTLQEAYDANGLFGGEFSISGTVGMMAAADGARGLADALGVTITAARGTREETAQLDQVLAQAGPAMTALGISTGDLQEAAANGTLPKLVAQIEAYGDGSTKSAAAQLGLKQSIEEATNAMRAQSNEALAAIDAQVAFEQAVDDARAAAVAGAGFNADTEGGRTNLTQASSVAAKFNALPDATIGQYRKAAAAIQAIGDKAGASDKRIRDLQVNLVKPAALQITDNTVKVSDRVKALGDLLKGIPKNVVTDMAANGIPRTRADVMDLKKQYDLTPPEVRTLMRLMGVPKTKGEIREVDGLVAQLGKKQAEPKVSANIKPFLGAHAQVTADLNATSRKTVTPTVRLRNQASGPIATIRSEMANLRDKTVTLTVQRRVVGAAIQIGAMAAAAAGQADGGTVTGAPRQPYGDKVLTFLAPGEEVVSNRHGQADRHRPLLKAINANALADGGTVTRLADGGRVPETTSRGPRATGLAAGDPHAPVRAGAKAAEQSLKGLAKQVKASERAVEREQKERDKIAEQLQSTRESQRALSSTVAERLRSDLWNQEADGNVFGRMSLGTDPREIARADIADARRFKTLRSRLTRRGISDQVLESVAAEGGLDGLEQIASYSAAEVRDLNRLYATRQRLTRQAGAQVGSAVYGDEVAVQTRELKAQTAELRAAKQHHRALERKVDRLEKAVRQKAKADDKSRGKHGKDTAKETGKQVRNAGARGARNKRYGGR